MDSPAAAPGTNNATDLDNSFNFSILAMQDELFYGRPLYSADEVKAAAEQSLLPHRAPKLAVMAFFTASTSHQISRSISSDGRTVTYGYHDMDDPANLITEIKHSRFSPDSGPATTFPLFSKLACEIRMMIWQKSMEGRTVELRISHHKVRKNGSLRYDLVGPFPTLLRPICREARELGLKAYTPAAFKLRYKCTKGILFNFELDTLHFRGTQRWNTDFHSKVVQHIPDLDKVRNLSVMFEFLIGPNIYNGDLHPLLLFPSLEKVTMCGSVPELGGASRLHPGGCHAQGTAGSWFLDENEVAPACVSAIRKEMQMVESMHDGFMRHLREGELGEVIYGDERGAVGLKDVKIIDGEHVGRGWIMPEFAFKAVCTCGIPVEEFNIPLLDRFQRRWSIPPRE